MAVLCKVGDVVTAVDAVAIGQQLRLKCVLSSTLVKITHTPSVFDGCRR